MPDYTQLDRRYDALAIRAQYRRVAWFYDSWSRLTEELAVRRLLQLVAVRDGACILEVAVGTGRLAAELLARNPSGQFEGVELSGTMLERAARRLSETRPAGSWHLQQADTHQLPFRDQSFDYLFNTYMLDLLPADDFPAILAEFSRVLRPGGVLAIAAFSFGTRPVHRLWYWLARFLPGLLTGCRPVRLAAALQEAGFASLQQEEISQNTFPSVVLVARKPG